VLIARSSRHNIELVVARTRHPTRPSTMATAVVKAGGEEYGSASKVMAANDAWPYPAESDGARYHGHVL
jgi:hypothetical protein